MTVVKKVWNAINSQKQAGHKSGGHTNAKYAFLGGTKHTDNNVKNLQKLFVEIVSRYINCQTWTRAV